MLMPFAGQRAKWCFEGEEQGAVRAARAHLSKVAQNGRTHRHRQRIGLRLAQLRPHDADCFRLPIQVVEGQSLDLPAPQTIVDQQRQDRVIPYRPGVVASRGGCQQAVDLVNRRCSGNIFEIVEARQVYAVGETGLARSLVGREPEEASQAATQGM
jgi:hypothetical protein